MDELMANTPTFRVESRDQKQRGKYDFLKAVEAHLAYIGIVPLMVCEVRRIHRRFPAKSPNGRFFCFRQPQPTRTTNNSRATPITPFRSGTDSRPHSHVVASKSPKLKIIRESNKPRHVTETEGATHLLEIDLSPIKREESIGKNSASPKSQERIRLPQSTPKVASSIADSRNAPSSNKPKISDRYDLSKFACMACGGTKSSIKCCSCGKPWHLSCANLQREDLNQMNRKRYRCPVCEWRSVRDFPSLHPEIHGASQLSSFM
jgi:hypothetical protein